ncbi:M protein, serotype 21 [Teratosphaeria destructans]|uniref:M protein, serotype 21 n=1 Tax=Teratosphaeria destructans TaxID=418781 RepID=A0A9W7W066_9PEZI|nr:M protein, serotype 21 [Teratosphaeria destructans]
MSATPKGAKPPTPSGTRRPTSASTTSGGVKGVNTTESPARSPSRAMAHTQSSGASAAANGINRTRSVRNGAPVSARAAAAARKPQSENDSALEDMRAEMQAKLDELQEKLQQAEQACEDSQKQAQILQAKLDAAHTDQTQLEESVHEQNEKLEELENQKKESLRAKRELEQIYEAERAQTMKEKEIAQQKEAEMQTALQRVKETLAQRELRAGLEPDHHARPTTSSRASSFRSDAASPKQENTAQFAPPGSVQRSDSRSSSRLVMQKDKIIEDLRLELAEAHFKLVEADNVGGGRLQQLQKELYEIKMQNARLMEDNDSFQLLLSEKTMNGDVLHSDLLRPPSMSESRPLSSRNVGGASLADELEGHDDSLIEGDSLSDDASRDKQMRALRSEVSSLKDQNKALTLYINNIISRLLQHDQFEAILDKTPDLMNGAPAAPAKRASQKPLSINKELPPPPPPKDKPAAIDSQPEEQPQGILGRAKSVLGRGGRRPQSQMVGPGDQERLAQQLKGDDARLTENPQTAPRVPLARASSARGSHRRANSEISGAASVVTSMYRGPSPGSQGPRSPGLTSPTGSRGFFGPPPLVTRVPTRQQDLRASLAPQLRRLQLPGRDLPAGEISSSGPSSPPRSTTSSADRDKASGAIMMGSKPRPLRLVQEAAEEEKERKASNRSSWFGNVGGWMANKAAASSGRHFGADGGAQ